MARKKKQMSVIIQCIKRTDIMSSLSQKDDKMRKSPRKSAGQMPHYLARELDKHMGGKEGRSREVVRRNGQKKVSSFRRMIAYKC